MASLRIIRRRLRSIHNTQQIMRAMQLVSASKLKRAQARLAEVHGVMEFLDGLLQRVLRAEASPERSRGSASPQRDHPLCAVREGERLLVVCTSDTGLCGSYNANLIQLAQATLQADTAHPTRLIYIGKKGHRYFTKRGYPALEAYLNLAGRPHIGTASQIGRSLTEWFLSGKVASVQLLYSRFVSTMRYKPVVEPWLPIQLSRQPSAVSRQQEIEYIFEPSPRRVFEDLLPRWALAKFRLILFEAFTSEHSARMIAMKNATDNASDLIDRLTMERNKIRQASITKEMSEIVGTVEALK